MGGRKGRKDGREHARPRAGRLNRAHLGRRVLVAESHDTLLDAGNRVDLGDDCRDGLDAFDEGVILKFWCDGSVGVVAW